MYIFTGILNIIFLYSTLFILLIHFYIYFYSIYLYQGNRTRTFSSQWHVIATFTALWLLTTRTPPFLFHKLCFQIINSFFLMSLCYNQINLIIIIRNHFLWNIQTT